MTPKTIIVDLSWPSARTRALKAAAELAQHYGAQLVGISAKRAFPAQPFMWSADRIAASLEATTNENMEAEHAFFAVCNAHEVLGHWQEEQGSRVSLLARASRYADLVVLEQQPELAPPNENLDDLPQRLVLAAACPVLVVPREGNSTPIPERILVAWKDCKEAARAVREALPFLQQAASVHVISIGEKPADALFGFLRRHGIVARRRHVKSANHSEAEKLLSEARELGCGLLIMGAYGHWRLQELIFGGVTNDIFQNASLPIFASH